MKKNKYIFIIVTISIATSFLISRDFRVSQIPNGGVNSCANCHINPLGGGPRNNFGQNVEASFLNSQGNVQWGPLLASLDSDGDGFSNGVELQNPTGHWSGGPSGDPSKVTNPGDPASKPNTTFINDILLPQKYILYNNYPNPFNPSTTISFEIPQEEYVLLKIYNSIGELVRTLVQEYKSPGKHNKTWDGKDEFGKSVISGIYFYYLKAGHFEKSNRMVLIK